MPDWKTCSTPTSRKKYDDKRHLGKVWMYARYSRNHSCHDVGADDCPNNYKTVGNNTLIDDWEDTVQSHTYFDTVKKSSGDCVDGGNWEIVSRDMGSNPNIATDTGTYPGHTAESYHDSYDCVGCLWPDDDNYTKVCYKDREGWKRTDPTDGRRRTTPSVAGNWERHKNICCGFDKTQRSVTSDKYCDWSYCWEPPNGTGAGHDGGRLDKISQSCQPQLESLCRTWGNNTVIGFEDERCSTAVRQIVDKERKASTADAGERQRANKLTAQISENSYKNNGKNLCTSDIFRNRGTTGSATRKKFTKCMVWCQDYPGECGPKITEACQDIYNQYKTRSSWGPEWRSIVDDNDDICACNWPDEFYQEIKDEYKEKYNASDHQVTAKRECLHQPCGDAAIKPALLEDRITQECDDKTFVTCIQEVEASFDGATVTGDTDIIIEAQQECGTLSDTGGAAGSGGADDEEDVEGEGEEEDKSKIIVVVIIIIILLMLAAAGIILM